MTALDLIGISRDKPIHFMGIGGAGMSPLAALVQRSGGRVTGCDARPSDSARALVEMGIEVALGHDPAHIQGCAALVITAAVSGDHPEIAAAHQAGIPVLKRAEALGAIVNRGQVIGIAGTHGKTTTTALTTAALSAGGLDPTGLVGGRVLAWSGNLRPGSDTLFVVEADEYDRSFLTLRPSIAVITTLEADHLDIYQTLSAVEDAFVDYLERVPPDGRIIACADDAGVGRVLGRLGGGEQGIETYGLNAGSTYRAEQVEGTGGDTTFLVREHGVLLGRAHLQAPGIHNVRNALAAVAVGRALGLPWDALAEGIASYSGVQRRFERIGEAEGVLVVDDYAHHPTEIAATLAAARLAYPERRIVAVFQPHLYSRTRDFAQEFGRSLKGADVVFVTEIFAARERPIAGVTGEVIAAHARDLGANVRYLESRAEVTAAVASILRPGDLCLTIGAGDLDAAARELVMGLQIATAGAARAE